MAKGWSVSRFRKVLILLLFLVPASALAVTAGVEDAKSIARLYSAAFDRKPDIGGLNYWIGVYEAGQSLPAIAGGFYKSPEFTTTYGTLSDQQYVEQLYRNVLGRAGEQEGVGFWTNHLSNGVSRARILAEFASSPENVAKTADMFADLRMMNCQWSFGPEQPISGNTGCLVGLVASGVTYKTPTHQGVTGPAGDFHYGDGETVRFIIGDTLLGEVIGQAQMTPFDLAGSPVVTGLNIEWALDRYGFGGTQVGPPTPSGSIYIDEEITSEYGPFPGSRNDPFYKLVNMVVFLQSLDADADPTNGIEIRTDVAALFERSEFESGSGVGRRFSTSQHYVTPFGERTTSNASVKHIGSLTRHQHFNTFIRVWRSTPELPPLARSGIGTCSSADANSSVQYQYDADGNTTRVKTSSSDGTVDEVFTRQIRCRR